MKVLEWMEQRKNSENYVIVTEKEKLTYKDLYEYSISLAKKISEQVDMDIINVALYTNNAVEYVVGYFSILYAGKCIVPIKKGSTQENISHILHKANTKWILTDDMIVSDDMICIFIDRNKGSYFMLGETQSDFLLLETTGTTGTSGEKKLVRVSETNMCFVVSAYVDALELREKSTVNFFVLVSLQSAYGNYIFLSCVYIGATVVIQEDFYPWNFRNVVLENNITHVECISTLLISLLKIYDQTEWGTLSYIGFGGESISDEEIELILSKFPKVEISQGYGLTEACPLITVFPPRLSIDNQDKFKEKIRSVGKVLPGIKAKIDTQKNDSIGEVLVKGPNITKGYYQEECCSIFKGEYLRTGDIGYLDKEGYLYISGRIKNIAIIEGNNIHLETVEQAIRQHPRVKEVRVYAKKDSIQGERLYAEVVSSGVLTENDLKEFLQKKIELYKIPSHIIFVNEIRKIGGKIVRT